MFVALSGFLGGLCAYILLLWFIGVDYFPAVLGIPALYGFIFPLLSAAIGVGVSQVFNPKNFGAVQGALVVMLSFVVFCFCYGLFGFILMLLEGSPSDLYLLALIWMPLRLIMFGSVIVGWALVLIGAVFGMLFRAHSNKELNAHRRVASGG